MAKNVHKVQKKMWKKFGSDGQAMFNRIWSNVIPELMPPIPHVKLTKKQFSILRWNICCTAASTMKEWDGLWGDQQDR